VNRRVHTTVGHVTARPLQSIDTVDDIVLMDTGFKQIPRSQWEDTFWHMPQQPDSVYVKAAVKFALLRSMTGYLLTFSLLPLASVFSNIVAQDNNGLWPVHCTIHNNTVLCCICMSIWNTKWSNVMLPVQPRPAGERGFVCNNSWWNCRCQGVADSSVLHCG